MPLSGRAEFLKQFPVSHETLAKLDRYAELLAEWSRKFNLVAKSTLPDIWTRHFLDSAQLLKFIPAKAGNIADLGSGAGFPGLVLAIMGAPQVDLIESTGKKADFLRIVADELKLNASVHQSRIEDIRGFRADVITARAVAPLKELIVLANPLMKKDSLCLFLKGRNADAELTESAKYWRFACEKHTSISDPSGSVLILTDLKFKHASPRTKFSRFRR